MWLTNGKCAASNGMRHKQGSADALRAWGSNQSIADALRAWGNKQSSDCWLPSGWQKDLILGSGKNRLHPIRQYQLSLRFPLLIPLGR